MAVLGSMRDDLSRIYSTKNADASHVHVEWLGALIYRKVTYIYFEIPNLFKAGIIGVVTRYVIMEVGQTR